MDSGSWTDSDPQAPPPIPAPPPPPDGSEPGAPSRRRRTFWIAGGVVAGVLVLVGVVVVLANGASVGVPDQVDGMALITTGPLGEVLDTMANDSGFGGRHAVGAAYGTPTQPEFIFIAAQGSESAAADRHALQEAAGGGTVHLDPSSITTETRDGVIYRCAPITGTGISGEACLWNDGKTLGMVFSFSERANAAEFASRVHDAVVS